MTPASRRTLKWWVQVDFATGTSMLPQVRPSASASAATIWRRIGSLTACRTAASSISSRRGWLIPSSVLVVIEVPALYDIYRTFATVRDSSYKPLPRRSNDGRASTRGRQRLGETVTAPGPRHPSAYRRLHPRALRAARRRDSTRRVIDGRAGRARAGRLTCVRRRRRWHEHSHCGDQPDPREHPNRAERQADSGVPGRRAGARHHPAGPGLGGSLLPDLLLPGRRRPLGTARVRPRRRALAEPRRRPDVHGQSRRQGGAGRGSAVRGFSDRGAAGSDPPRLEGDGRVVRGGRGGVHPRARPPHTRRHPPQLEAGSRGGRRRDDRGLEQPEAALRDRPTGPLLPAEDARTHGAVDADGHREPLPVQGPGRVLVGPGRRSGPRGPRVVVSDAAARERADRRIDRFLQRQGRPVRRWGASGIGLQRTAYDSDGPPEEAGRSVTPQKKAPAGKRGRFG